MLSNQLRVSSSVHLEKSQRGCSRRREGVWGVLLFWSEKIIGLFAVIKKTLKLLLNLNIRRMDTIAFLFLCHSRRKKHNAQSVMPHNIPARTSVCQSFLASLRVQHPACTPSHSKISWLYDCLHSDYLQVQYAFSMTTVACYCGCWWELWEWTETVESLCDAVRSDDPTVTQAPLGESFSSLFSCRLQIYSSGLFSVLS